MSDDSMATDTYLALRRQRGFSYVEVLIAVVIIAVCLVPALDALRDGVRAAGTELDYTKNQQRLKTRFEDVLANNFATLDAAAIAAGNNPGSTAPDYSDVAGTADRLLVTLYRYDPAVAIVDGIGATPTATGLLRINVSIESSNFSLNTLKSQ